MKCSFFPIVILIVFTYQHEYFTLLFLDQTPPTFSQCDRTITVIADTNLATGLVTWNVSATDNNGIPTVESTGRSGLRFMIGNDTIDFTATDSSNNTATCSLNIQVLGKSLLLIKASEKDFC